MLVLLRLTPRWLLSDVRAGRLLYGRALHACALARAWKEADTLLREMVDNGVVPDDSTFYELIEGARLSQSFQKITKYRAMMVDKVRRMMKELDSTQRISTHRASISILGHGRPPIL